MNRLWAKTTREATGAFHPLPCHLLDVAAVARNVFTICLHERVRDRLTSAIGESDPESFFAFLAGAHDIGKACPGFQKRLPNLARVTGLSFSTNNQCRPHGIVSAHAIKEFLGKCPAATLFGQIVGGHHGVFPRSSNLRIGADVLGNGEWNEVRVCLLSELARVVGLDLDQARKALGNLADPFIVPVLAGFVSVVDWIGSNQEFFPYVGQQDEDFTTSPDDYWIQAQDKAVSALEALGWLPTVTFQHEAEFNEVFVSFTPNKLQESVIEIARAQSCPYLMIIEAPMGQGKTEAALYAADLAMCRGVARGLYVAMPTQATSNAMFRRVLDDYLKRRKHSGKLNVQLVHGNALLAESGSNVAEGEVAAFEPDSVQDDSSHEDVLTADVEAQSWFTARKRPLLAPFGVGTIDQSLLSVLQTRHWFVRMFGLAGKLVIFDEVHAYDAYMSTILERLLHWLAELDCTVILLSATLPDARRKALVEAYSGRNNAESQRYPRITIAQPRHFVQGKEQEVRHKGQYAPQCVHVPMGDLKSLVLTVASPDLSTLSGDLYARLINGGCAAVICNTVDRSIEVYRHLQANLQDTECLLFHARTLQMWRRAREEEVLGKFGKNGERPKRAVLVATQVVEQSLDLDFDLLVSEIAPMDLLLQRAGRLHRHPRQRPNGLERPELIVLCDAKGDRSPPKTFGENIEHVYDRYVLLRTWLAIREKTEVEVPNEIEHLIEFVYANEDAPEDDGWQVALEDAKRTMDFERAESERRACRLLISKPNAPCDLIEQFNDQLVDDEDPEVHASVRAATREGDPTITAVLLPPEATLTQNPQITEVRYLLDRSVKFSHRGLVDELLRVDERPREWANCPHLRHARAIRLDAADKATVGRYLLTMDERLGVVIAQAGED